MCFSEWDKTDKWKFTGSLSTRWTLICMYTMFVLFLSASWSWTRTLLHVEIGKVSNFHWLRGGLMSVNKLLRNWYKLVHRLDILMFSHCMFNAYQAEKRRCIKRWNCSTLCSQSHEINWGLLYSQRVTLGIFPERQRISNKLNFSRVEQDSSSFR